MIDRWRLDYNHHRIHSSLDYQTPAAYTAGCVLPDPATPQPPKHSCLINPNPCTEPGAKTGGSQYREDGPTLASTADEFQAENLLTGDPRAVRHCKNTLNNAGLKARDR